MKRKIRDIYVFLKGRKMKVFALLLAVILIDASLLSHIEESPNPELYFLDVGQGDAELIILPGGFEILVDGGPSGSKLLNALSRVRSFSDRYIDLVILSHPQEDHFGGLFDLLDRYEIGAFAWNGEKSTGLFPSFLELLEQKDIPRLILRKGGRISHPEGSFRILYPERISDDVNENSLVFLLETSDVKILFTGDIGVAVEKFLSGEIQPVDILKVSHHGSRYSTGLDFLRSALPRISVIEVGDNKYGHPTPETQNAIRRSGSLLFRTDENGTVRISIDRDKIRVFTEYGP